MKKIILISLAVLTSLIALLLSAATYAVATADGQQRAKNLVLGILSDNLDTPIQLDSISLEVLKGNLNLYGLLINDLKGMEMLRVDTLEVGVALGRLLFHDEIVVNRAVLSGVKATLYKEHKDSAANYQFLIKPKKPSPEKKKKKTNLALIPYVKRAAIRNASLRWDVHSETPKDKGKFDANHFDIHHFSTEIKTVVKDTLLTYAEIRQFTAFERNSGAKLSLPQLNLTYDPKNSAEVRLNLSGLDAQFEDKIVRLKKLAATSGWADLLQQKNIRVDVEELYFHNDNGKPRKNLDNPKKPAFDAGHLDATANLSLLIQRIRHDSIEARVQHLDVKDSVNGLDIKNLTVDV
ncbi:MAG: hypothetical protein HUJ99_07485, partial [Bacteroidaceae bacterium]|nr:hypothetical protein [Bacteroidaceae bacterium]